MNLLRRKYKILNFFIFFLLVSIQIVFVKNGCFSELCVSFATSSNVMTNSSENNLQEIIRQKTEELQQFQKQRQLLQDKLNFLSSSKNSLSKEIQTLTYQISQLDLQIKANRLITEKLELEIKNSTQDIQEIEQQIANTKEAINKLMLELQQKNDQSLLFIVLSEDTFSNVFNEVSTAYLLNKELLKNIENLSSLEKLLMEKINETNKKKNQKQIESINLINIQNILQNQKETKDYLLSQTKNQEKIYKEELEKLEEQQLAISQTIEKIESQLRANFNFDLLSKVAKEIFTFPVPLETLNITQAYGYTKFAERAYRNNFHTGVDFGVPIGTPIYAAADGVVVRVDNNDRGISRFLRYQYGKYILIKHNNNLTTLYAHLSKQIVKEGNVVNKGQLIGYSGTTGYSFGPHLHFGVYYGPELELKSIHPASGLIPVGVTVDPMLYLPAL